MALFGKLKSLFSDGPPSRPFLCDYHNQVALPSGGMSRIYKAEHRATGEIRIIKKVTPSTAEARRKFKQELAILFSLDHENLVRALGYERQEDAHYVLMEYIDGVSLRKLGRHSALVLRLTPAYISYRQFAEVLSQATQALKYMHDQGVLHMDVKPENILLIGLEPYAREKTVRKGSRLVRVLRRGWRRTGKLQVKLIDFGVARRKGEKGSGVGGSALYAAPEMVQSTAISSVGLDEHTDLYCLGATFYELACGRPAYLPRYFEGKPRNWQYYWAQYRELPALARSAYEAEMFKARLQSPPDFERIPYPDPMRKLLKKCLELPVQRRYPSTAALLHEVEAIVAQFPPRE